MIKHFKRWHFIFLFISILIFNYYELIIVDPILNYDDASLINALRSITSPFDYIKAIISGRIMDIQPIRDLSYLLDFKLFEILPWYSFHFSNLVYLIAICFFLEKILKSTKANSIIIALAVTFFALSPTTTGSVAWIAARKHLLSALFILWATSISLKKVDQTRFYYFKIFCLYSLSVFSHPITILWPLWLAYSNNLNFRNACKEKTLLSLQILMSFFIGLNFYYYKFIYSSNVSSFSKFSSFSNLDLGKPFLAIGRYFFQAIVPFGALPTSHYPGSYENFIGLVCVIIFAFVLLKIHRDSHFRIPLFFAFFPLIIVTFNMTNIFCSDTYLLIPSIGLFWTLSLYFSQTNIIKKRYYYAAAAYILITGLFNFQYTKIFLDEENLWNYAYTQEATPHSAGIVSTNFVKRGLYRESYDVIQEVSQRWPEHPYLSQLIGENVFFNRNISNVIKISTLEKSKNKTPSTYFYLSILYGRENRILDLEKNIHHIFENPQMFNTEFRGAEEQIAASYIYMCDSFGVRDCKKKLNKFVHANIGERWNPQSFDYSLSRLKTNSNFNLDIKI